MLGCTRFKVSPYRTATYSMPIQYLFPPSCFTSNLLGLFGLSTQLMSKLFCQQYILIKEMFIGNLDKNNELTKSIIYCMYVNKFSTPNWVGLFCVAFVNGRTRALLSKNWKRAKLLVKCKIYIFSTKIFLFLIMQTLLGFYNSNINLNLSKIMQ